MQKKKEKTHFFSEIFGKLPKKENLLVLFSLESLPKLTVKNFFLDFLLSLKEGGKLVLFIKIWFFYFFFSWKNK